MLETWNIIHMNYAANFLFLKLEKLEKFKKSGKFFGNEENCCVLRAVAFEL